MVEFRHGVVESPAPPLTVVWRLILMRTAPGRPGTGLESVDGPEITASTFIWRRQTGKRVTFYATNDNYDGDIRSNRVTNQTS